MLSRERARKNLWTILAVLAVLFGVGLVAGNALAGRADDTTAPLHKSLAAQPLGSGAASGVRDQAGVAPGIPDAKSAPKIASMASGGAATRNSPSSCASPETVVVFWPGFNPQNITIALGDSVVFFNQDPQFFHSATENNGAFDILIPPNGANGIAFDGQSGRPGVGFYAYTDAFGSGSTGTIQVNACPPTVTPTHTNTPGPPEPRTCALADHYFQLGSFSSPSVNCDTATQHCTGYVGDRLILDEMIHTGPFNITAHQGYIDWRADGSVNLVKHARVSDISSTCTLTNVVTPDLTIFDATLQNEVCNGPGFPCTFYGIDVGPGSFAFASGALNNPAYQGPPDFRVAQTAWCLVAPGTATLRWQFVPPDPITRDTQIVDENTVIVNDRLCYVNFTFTIYQAIGATPTSTSTPSPTITPTSTAVIVGHVTWQGISQPNTRSIQPITLTLKLGATEVNYPSQNTDSSGFFTVSLGSLPNGTYNWRVKGPKSLANVGTVALTGASVTQAEMGTMRAGDCNGDNVVNVGDFNILRATFGKSIGQPGYDARADFNGDATVNVGDFNLLRGNFGIAGAPPISPGGP